MNIRNYFSISASVGLFSMAFLLLPHHAFATDWEGWYEQDGRTVPFSMSSNSSRETFLQGRTYEMDTLARSSDVPLHGEASGERRGRIWFWTKNYTNVNRDPIEYLGTLSPDGSRVIGWWNIGSLASGQFEMRVR